MRAWKHIQSKLTEAIGHLLPPDEPEPWEQFRHRAKEVVGIAQEEAHCDEVTPSTGYLLLGLLRGEDPDSQTLLRQMGVDAQALLDYVEENVLNSHEVPHPEQPWLSSEGHRVLDIATREAHSLGWAHVDTLHLMLGMITAEETWAAHVLRDSGINPDAIRAYIVEVYGHSLLQPSDACHGHVDNGQIGICNFPQVSHNELSASSGGWPPCYEEPT